MPDARKCPRCGRAPAQEDPFCPYCGASMRRGEGGDQAPAPKGFSGGPATKAVLILVAALLVAVAVDIVLRLDAQREPIATQAPLALATVPSPTPKPTKEPVSSVVIGAWEMTRVETNTKKPKDLAIELSIGADRTRIEFLPDGTAQVRMPGEQQSVQREWYCVGEDIFIDKGQEMIDGKALFGRNRFFFNGDELYYVYTLDGSDASNYAVYGRVSESLHDIAH